MMVYLAVFVFTDVHNHLYPSLRHIFLVVHHKEIGMKIDTAKSILSTFPTKCQLVVGGIGPEYQDSMNKEMLHAIQKQQQQQHNRTTCLFLFQVKMLKYLMILLSTPTRNNCLTNMI
jgi:hypothetical protein